MRSYCAIYVDVGYLLASAATRVTGTSLRRGVQVDHPELIRGLIERAETDCGLPLLRVNWYDSGARPGGMPDFVQDEIGLLPRVKLRLGRLSHAGEQKGVDLRIGLDLATHGRNRVVDVIYLVSGDDDLTEAVEEAQGHGVQVILLAVPGQDERPHGVARHLQRAADGLILLDGDTVDQAVRSRAIPEALVPDEHKDEAASGQDPDSPPEEQALEPAGADGSGVSQSGLNGVGPATALEAASSDAEVPMTAAHATGPPGPGEDLTLGEDLTRGRGTRESQSSGDRTSEDERAEDQAADVTAGQPDSGPSTGDATPGETTPVDATPGETTPADATPGETTAGEDKPRDDMPAEDTPAQTGETSDPATAPSPTPSLFAKKKASALLPPPEPVWSTSTGVTGAGTYPDTALDPEIIDTVARQVIRSWCTTATPKMLAELKEQRPSIPGDLDRAMLVDLSNRSGHYDVDEHSRHELRNRFWELVGQVRLS